MSIKKIFLFGVVVLSLQTQTAVAAELIDLNTASSETISSLPVVDETSKTRSFVNTEVGDFLKVLVKENNPQSGKHVRYQQYYKGLPVFGYHVLTHKTADQPERLSGTLVNNIEQDVAQVSLSKSADLTNIINQAKADYIQQENTSGEKTIASSWKVEDVQAKAIIYLDEDQKAHEGFYVSFFVENPITDQPAMPHFIIDASSKKIVKYWNGLTTADILNSDEPMGTLYQTEKGVGPGGNDKVGVFEYGTQMPNLKMQYAIDKNGAYICYLANQSVKVIDKQNRGQFATGVDYKWSCNNNFRHAGDSINGGASPSNDALYNTTFVVETYEKMFSERLMPVGQKLPVNVHYKDGFDNAMWKNGSIILGDGGEVFYPLTSLDILGHEMSHGITEKYSNLVYEQDSGGLNESFSDIAGKTIEAISLGKTDKPNEVVWKIGADVMKDEEALRYMDNPEKDKESISHLSKNNKRLDPHHSSGIFNKAFYLMVNTKVNNKYVGMLPMFKVFLHANKTYWQPQSTFVEAAHGVLQAEQDLYKGQYTSVITNAFLKVGIKCDANKCQRA